MGMSLENKIKKVNNGKSEVFNNWNNIAGISKDAFIEALKWLEEDPMTNINGTERLTGDVGCKKDGTLIYGKRFYLKNGYLYAIYPIDKSLTKLDFPSVSINKLDWI